MRGRRFQEDHGTVHQQQRAPRTLQLHRGPWEALQRQQRGQLVQGGERVHHTGDKRHPAQQRQQLPEHPGRQQRQGQMTQCQR